MVAEKRGIALYGVQLSGCYENLFRQNRFFEGVCFLSLADDLCHILVRGSFLDVDRVFGGFEVFHVGSSTANAWQFLRSSYQDEVLVDHINNYAFLSRFPTVKFDTDTSDFDGGHRDNLPRLSPWSKSSFKVSWIFAGLSSLFEPSQPL